MSLTDRQVAKLKLKADYHFRYKDFFDALGLSIRVNKVTNLKRWVVQYTLNKKRKMMMLGDYPTMSLVEARQERDRIRKMALEGRDPKIDRDMKKANVVSETLHTVEHIFQAITKERINSKTNTWSKSHIKRTGFTWNHLKPIANVPIAELTKPKLRELLVSINQNIGASTGDKCKALMSSIYSYAVLNDIVPKNLVSDFAKDPELRKRKPEDVAQHPPIPLDRLGETFTLINESNISIVTRYALFFLQYTSLRVGSLLANRWEDYDSTKKILHIQPQFIKNRKAIICPVIDEMKAMFDSLKLIQQNSNDAWNKKCFIFSMDGKTPLNEQAPNNALKKLLATHKLGFRAVPHGFRNTCETHWINSRFLQTAINVQSDHKSTTGDAVRDRYISKDEFFIEERTKMLEAMAKLIKDAMNDYALLQKTIENASSTTPSSTKETS